VNGHNVETMPTRARSLVTSGATRALIAVLRARARLFPDDVALGSVGIVMVNLNSLAVLRETSRRVLSTPGRRQPELLVVDNGSTDGSGEWLAGQRDLRGLRLPWNAGHGAALDLGFLLLRTEYAVALDVDAFPIADDWLDRLLEPLERREATVSGILVHRDFVHPSCLAMRRADFVACRHTFRPRWTSDPAALGLTHWDTGERISMRERGRVAYLPVTSVRGPGWLGTVYGGIVYHNFYAVRKDRSPDELLDGLVAPEEVERAWDEALRRYPARR
jgi:glycosyltransferase involved in cell wall biosynthesis